MAADPLQSIPIVATALDDSSLAHIPESLNKLLDELPVAGAKDVFRRSMGFERVLASMELCSWPTRDNTIPRNDSNIQTMQLLLKVLREALNDHHGNRKYFARKLDGWASLRQQCQGFQCSRDLSAKEPTANLAALYDLLLSIAFQNPRISAFTHAVPLDERPEERDREKIPLPSFRDLPLINAEAFSILIHLALSLIPVPAGQGSGLASFPSLALEIALDLADGNGFNFLAMWKSTLPSCVLKAALRDDITGDLSDKLRKMVETLGELGLRELGDAAVLFESSTQSASARKLLATLMRVSRRPASFKFDLRRQGYSSIEFSSLPRHFPSDAGYALAAWIKVDEYDPSCHTTIFGAYDQTQQCFVLIYLEKDSHQLILQTSVRQAAIPSIRFKMARFATSTWYHVVVVHRRNASNPDYSMASLSVNGDFVEQRKCSYPEMPDLPTEKTQPYTSAGSQRRSRPVQAFFGTPSGIAASTGSNVVKSVWHLASAQVYQTPVTDEFIAVQYRLGPRYHGNFQDSLGPLLTYRASAELHQHNELLHPERSERSDIIAATEGRGSDVMPEHRLLLGVDPNAAIVFDEAHALTDFLEGSIGLKASTKFHQLSQRARSVALNMANPVVSEAITRSCGTGVLAGGISIMETRPLDDLSWSLAGSLPVLFRLLESAVSKNAFLESTRTIFDCVKDNWRISEAMEKGHGYGLLAVIIREKLGMEVIASSHATSRRPSPLLSAEDRQDITHSLLELILDFVGYSKSQPNESVLINPMAYRVLLLDFDTWRRCDLTTQALYWQQFKYFIKGNRHQQFNHKRLARMRVVKKVVEALKSEEITEDSAALMTVTLRALLEMNTTHSVYREFAMFVTFGLHDERAMPVGHLRSLSHVVSIRQKAVSWARGARSPRSVTPVSTSLSSTPTRPAMSRSELAVMCLRLIVDILYGDDNGQVMKRFNKAVPNRWLLHLLAEQDVRVVELAVKIISHALTVLGPEFKDPFAGRNVGFITLKARLKPFWRSKATWASCFAILFGRSAPKDISTHEFGAFYLVEVLSIDESLAIAHQEMLPVLFAMLEAGFRHVAKTDHPDPAEAGLLAGMIQFLNELYSRSSAFREFAVSSRYTKELLFVLFPLLTGSDRLSAETELAADKEALTFKGEEVKMRPHSRSIGERPPSVRSLSFETGKRTPSPLSANRVAAPRKIASFVLVQPGGSHLAVPPAQFQAPMSPKGTEPVRINVTNSLVESLLDLAIGIFIDQICNKDKFNGVGLFQKVPPGFREHQAYFESYVLVNTLAQLSGHLRLNQRLLSETKVLTNLARYTQHMAEAVSEGWFIDGAQPLLDFAGEILEHLQLPHISQLKSVRLCSQSVTSIRIVFLKATLWRLSELNEDSAESDVNDFLVKMTYWQTILFSPENQETLFTKLICYLLYHKLVSNVKPVRMAAARLWRFVLMQKPTEAATLITNAMGADQRHLSTGFMRLSSMDDDDFLSWVDQNRPRLDTAFQNHLSRPWSEFVQNENRISEESSKTRLSKRREKLKQWATEESSTDDFIYRFENSTNYWRSNVHSQERTRLQRAVQDHQESMNQLFTSYTKMERQVRQPGGLVPYQMTPRWQLDETEAINRMRMRILPDHSEAKEIIQPKRKYSQRRKENQLAINTQIPKSLAEDVLTPMPITPATPASNAVDGAPERSGSQVLSESLSNSQLLEGGFEMVEDPKEDEDGMIEDKNRKVMTSLQRGDAVRQLFNVSRIVGLEACEGLLIIGEKCLYIQDNFFQRSDGEIVGVSQAPDDERDPYVHQISGKDVAASRTKSFGEQEIRHWTWAEMLSVSKRRFLLRDVAIEVFFTDGRSYLLTCMTAKVRDDLYSSIINRAPHVHGTAAINGEYAWRLDSLRTPETEPQSLGSKFGNIFNSGPQHAATKKWMRGEMSNFQYLMLVNTMAGRTFNDLTQYPVFPWVLADYTSDELDLDNPRSYRDFSKPMGCQTSAREAEYKDRFKQFAEMGDHNAPPFHYGTHYSSAMIVSSYLIRLQPFVNSYLLLQGGSFDHADRLFDSIERAWLSASRENRSDVRELTPEFFYLPEFLHNMNSYDFGTKQGSGEAVNHVQLPKWAKGDPHIFIAKHREALESPYVSENLHQWIDLIFGFKQRGEAAIEATNCFHHLSYGGAKDLDKIDDPVERLATIGIIHSFGQTPHQVFQRSHPSREPDRQAEAKLDTLVETLIKLPDVMLRTGERVTEFTFSRSEKSLLACNPYRRNVPPHYDRYMQWGFADNSLRFFAMSTGRLLGLYENTHIGPITTATFVDSRTLLTAGVDCTIGVWTVSSPSRNALEITPKTYLFGHRTALKILTTSRVFSTLVSVSSDGHVLVWGLNRFNCIRELLGAGQYNIRAARISNVTGHILLATGAEVLLYTLNGHLLLKQRVSDRPEDPITAVAFYEGDGTEYLSRELIFTGHPFGIANVWQLENLRDGEWKLVLVKRMAHAVDHHSGDSHGVGAIVAGSPGSLASGKSAITCILPTARAVFTGDEEGNVWDWECVQRGAR